MAKQLNLHAHCVKAVARYLGCGLDWVRRDRHGDHAKTVVVGTERIRVRGPTPHGTWKTIEILACPVTFSPHPQQIDSARKAYDDWWQALGWVRDGLMAGSMLREVEVTGVMPKVKPCEPR